MLKISELIGKELICLNGAELAGVVGNVLFDKKLRAAKYLQILSDDEKEPEIQFVEFRRVKNPEADACVIANRSTLLCEWAIPAGLAVSPMNCACFDTNGQRLGYVRDIVLAEKNLVETILVSADIPHSSLLIPNLEFSPARLLSYSDRMLIINDAEKPVKLKKTRPRVPKNAGVVRVRVHGKEQGAERAKQITNSEKNIPNPSATPHSSLLIPNSFNPESRAPNPEPRPDGSPYTLPFRIPPEQTEVTRTPQKEPPDGSAYAFLLGKKLSRTICAGDGTLVAAGGALVDENSILLARQHGKLVHLALYAD